MKKFLAPKTRNAQLQDWARQCQSWKTDTLYFCLTSIENLCNRFHDPAAGDLYEAVRQELHIRESAGRH